MKIMGIDVTPEEFKTLFDEQANGKELVVKDGKIIAIDPQPTERDTKLARFYELDRNLKSYDYIGIKIATGRATKEQYATQIAQMTEWAEELDKLKKELGV